MSFVCGFYQLDRDILSAVQRIHRNAEQLRSVKKIADRGFGVRQSGDAGKTEADNLDRRLAAVLPNVYDEREFSGDDAAKRRRYRDGRIFDVFAGDRIRLFMFYDAVPCDEELF